MENKQKFFLCKYCGNMVGLIEFSGVPLVCCGAKMIVLEPNTVEASTEKHLPVVTDTDGVLNVKVGSVPHPMADDHHITFIYVETEQGGQRKRLTVGDKPEAVFSVTGDKPVTVYAYCNLHGLWAVDV